MATGIYCIIHLESQKRYFGSAVNLTRRWLLHRRHLIAQTHYNKKLQNAWNKYGEKSFEFQKLEECSVEKLIEREQWYLDSVRIPWFDYNLCPTAGNLTGYKHTPEARAKISESNRRQKGIATKSEYWKQQVSLAKTGKKFSEEHKRSLSKAKLGKPLSNDHKEKLAKSHIGRTISQETRTKISNAQKGRVVPLERRLKMSLAQKGNQNARRKV